MPSHTHTRIHTHFALSSLPPIFHDAADLCEIRGGGVEDYKRGHYSLCLLPRLLFIQPFSPSGLLLHEIILIKLLSSQGFEIVFFLRFFFFFSRGVGRVWFFAAGKAGPGQNTKTMQLGARFKPGVKKAHRDAGIGK